MPPFPITVAGAEPWDEDAELEAAWTVAAIRLGRPVRRDVEGAAPATHDFDVVLPDGGTMALEVTSLTVPEVVEMWAAIVALDWGFPELAFNWSISLQSASRGNAGTRVRRFHAEAPPLLAQLEQAGTGRFGDVLGGADSETSDPELRVIEELRRLGARSGGPVGRPASGPAFVVVGAVGPGGLVDGSDVNAGVERAALDNLDKLMAAEGTERHLFVWVDATDPGANVAMATYARPGPPVLPAGIDTVWVGLWQRNANLQSNASTLWNVTPPGPWHILEVPLVRNYANKILSRPMGTPSGSTS